MIINEGLLLRKLKSDFSGHSFKVILINDLKCIQVDNDCTFEIKISNEMKENHKDVFSKFYNIAKNNVEKILNGEKMYASPILKTSVSNNTNVLKSKNKKKKEKK